MKVATTRSTELPISDKYFFSQKPLIESDGKNYSDSLKHAKARLHSDSLFFETQRSVERSVSGIVKKDNFGYSVDIKRQNGITTTFAFIISITGGGVGKKDDTYFNKTIAESIRMALSGLNFGVYMIKLEKSGNAATLSFVIKPDSN